MMMKKPTSPGELIQEHIEEINKQREIPFTQTDFAQQLGTTRKTFNALLHDRQAVTPQMAIRLHSVFGCGAHFWLNVQSNYSLAELGYNN